MRHPMRHWMTALLGIAALCFCMSAKAGYTPGAGYTFNLGTEGVDANVGADMRIRLESYERTVVDPEMDTMDQGPAYDYLRVRTRLWAGVKVQDWMRFNIRLVNRVQDYSSRPGENNDGAATWEFPDETIYDLLNLQLLNIADSDWSLTIGRQEFPLGNGMVFLEGTPYDQGRTIYFDGISAVMKNECDTVKLFAFYDTYRDRTVVINDQERALRRGDIFTAGADWTHDWTGACPNFPRWFNTELYYIGAKVNGDTNTDGGNGDQVIHTAGLRLFGSPHEQIDYSLEAAAQYGQREMVTYHSYDDYYADTKSSDMGFTTKDDIDMRGVLVDARLTLKAPKGTRFSPSVLLQYTYFSGDEPDTEGKFEGWDPIFAAYPIYREELLPTMLRGNWTNLHQPRIEGRLAVSKCWSVAASYAYLLADEHDLPCVAGGGAGRTFGQLVTAFIDYQPLPWLSFALEVAEFFPGSYWHDGDNGTYGRFQTILTY